MTIEFKKTLTVQSYETTKLLAHESIVRSDGGEEDTWRDATPSDLASALAAMGEGERAEVLEHFRPAMVAYCNESIARAEKAERELADAGLERHGLRLKIEVAERERDEARLDLARALKSNTAYSVAADEAIRDRDMALGERNRAQAERDTERACRLENERELHRADKELGELRARLIAALKAERDDARLRCGSALATAATATARAEKAQRERDEARNRNEQRDRDWDVIRTLTDAGDDFTVAAVRRVVSERDSLLESVAAREKERDEARLDLDRAQAALAVVRHDLEGTRRDLGELRTRLIAAETAAAQREPREYPLAEGSRFEGPSLVTAGKARVNIRPYLGDGPPTLSMELLDGSGYWLYLADVLALAHRRGLV